ncbi:MAG TPA: hypothetical protein VEC38_14395 [Candidatus Binataceae bacterium]|nr:hypothetical protein [Candidatus Binataceae bacterium]
MGRRDFHAVLICASVLAVAGCFSSPQDEQIAEIRKQCEAGTISCVKPEDSKAIVACQAGDAVECQKVAVSQCEQGDRHVCQALAVERSELQPLCDRGARAACTAISASWPDPASWNPDDQIKAAQAACKTGDAESCRALSLTVHADGDRLVWTQNFIERAAKKSGE